MRGPLPASMRTGDGVRLDADVYVPDGDGPFPVLLMRQPYGRRIACTVCYAHPSWYAAHGYIVAIQDVRGRGSSEGDFAAFEHDARDGAESVAWAAALPGASGAVGMYGFSYQGTNQLLAAAEHPPALRALAPAMIGWDMRTDWAYEGGAFRLAAGFGWAIQLAAETARRGGDAEAFGALREAASAPPRDGPVPARPALMARLAALSHYATWIDTPDDAPYWRTIAPAARLDRLAASGVPMLFVGGWFDTHLAGTLAAFRALAPHVPARLVVGPWAHFPWSRHLGALDFGPTAHSRIDALHIRWFDQWLRGGPPDGGARIELFDLGTLDWRVFSDWPRTGIALHLGGDGRAALDPSAGTLAATPPADDDAEWLVHDPWRPAPSVAPGADRAAIDQRPDVLTFTTAPLDRPLALAGDIAARLSAEGDAPDFDLACTLSRVTAAGRVFALAEGYRRVRTSGAVTVPMRATCATLPAGDALRLSIAAAAFPAFPVNPGTGADPTSAGWDQARVITLRIRHGSRLVIGG